MPMTNDTIQVSTRVAPICAASSAQPIVLRRAAVETINRGYDRFMILASNMQAEFAGFLPGSATTTGSGSIVASGNMATLQGSSYTTYSPPTPMTAHTQTVVVKMFKDGDPAGSNAISARASLGPDWQKILKESSTTTC
ncbi:MAG: hypothetical protein EXQ95_00480 [Alphaproteobacteria bacterium]|nr:hypothetical protein [Alphaproteobacteria bacterium]